MPSPPDPRAPKLTTRGAVIEAGSGRIQVSAYQDLRKHFVDEWKCNHPQKDHPGLREGEEVPVGIRHWDHWQSSKRDSCGWIAAVPGPARTESGRKRKCVWFNNKATGSWRLSFLLARLQRKIWEERLAAGKRVTPSAGVLQKARQQSERLSKNSPVVHRGKASTAMKSASFSRVARKIAKRSARPPRKAQRATKVAVKREDKRTVPAMKAVKVEPGTTGGVAISFGRVARKIAKRGAKPTKAKKAMKAAVKLADKRIVPAMKAVKAEPGTAGGVAISFGRVAKKIAKRGAKPTKAKKAVKAAVKLAGKRTKTKRVPRSLIKERISRDKTRRLAKRVEPRLAKRSGHSKARVGAALSLLKVKIETAEDGARVAIPPSKTPASPMKLKTNVRRAHRKKGRPSKSKLAVTAGTRPDAKAADSPASPQKRKLVAKEVAAACCPGKRPGAKAADISASLQKRQSVAKEVVAACSSGKRKLAAPTVADSPPSPQKSKLDAKEVAAGCSPGKGKSAAATVADSPASPQKRKPVAKEVAAASSPGKRNASAASSCAGAAGGQLVLEDAPPGHKAFGKVSFQSSRGKYEIRLPVSEASSPSQPRRASVCLSQCGGSREDAARIARMMYVKSDQGAPWDEVRAWKNAMFARYGGGRAERRAVRKQMSATEALDVVGSATASQRQHTSDDRLVQAILAAENLSAEEFERLLAPDVPN